MNIRDLKAIIVNMDADGKLPVRVRVNFGESMKSYTIADVEKFRQWSDALQLNCTVEYPEVDKLMELRQWLVEETDRWTEKANEPGSSSNGEHYDRGHAAAFILVRDKLEKMFNYWDCR